MDNTIKVLKLDDDNHSPCYVTLGSYYHDAEDFIKALSQPHTWFFRIKEVRLVEVEWPDEDEFLRIFDDVACEYHPETLYSRDREQWNKREESFNKLWEVGESIWSKDF